MQQRWLELIGVPSHILAYACLFGLMYLFKPNDISKTPLGSLTLSDISGSVFWLVVVLGLVYWLFNPSDEPDERRAWGWVGIVMVAGGVIGAVYLTHQ